MAGKFKRSGAGNHQGLGQSTNGGAENQASVASPVEFTLLKSGCSSHVLAIGVCLLVIRFDD